MRRIGVLMDTAESNAEGQARFAAFQQVLHKRGRAVLLHLQEFFRACKHDNSNQG